MREAVADELVDRGVAVNDEDMRVFHRLISGIGTILIQKRGDYSKAGGGRQGEKRPHFPRFCALPQRHAALGRLTCGGGTRTAKKRPAAAGRRRDHLGTHARRSWFAAAHESVVGFAPPRR